jgi:hypothetical protein
MNKAMGSSSIQFPRSRVGLVLLLAAILGCGEADPFGVGATVEVSGRVLVGGAPLEMGPDCLGKVWFHPDAAKGNNAAQVPAGDIGPQGQFSLQTRGAKGAPPGWYKVMLTATRQTDPHKRYFQRKSLIPSRYGDPEKSGLRIEVAANAPEGRYDLHLKK